MASLLFVLAIIPVVIILTYIYLKVNGKIEVNINLIFI